MVPSRTSATIAAATLAGAALFGAPAAEAKSAWGPAQEVTSRLGWSLNISNDGRVASWLRSNRASDKGPARAAYYRGAKKGWTPSAEIAGTVGSRDVQMGSDGDELVADVPGTGYVMAERTTRNNWGPAQTIAAGQFLRLGKISADADAFIYGEFADPRTASTPGTVKLITRSGDGPWSAPMDMGQVPRDAYFAYRPDYLDMSGDGSTVVWLDNSWALRARNIQPDGTWSAPVTLKQFTEDPFLQNLSLSKDGTRVAWMYRYSEEDGVVTATRSGATWSQLSYITTDGVQSMALSPDGKVVTFVTVDGKLVLKSWTGTTWSRAKVMDTVRAVYCDMALTNKTLVWTYAIDRRLHASRYRKGRWQPATTLASTAVAPVMNANGRTVLWTSMTNKKVYSKKR